MVPINEEAGAKLQLQVRRPAGTMGEHVPIQVNHFSVLSLPTVQVYEYDIAMEIATEDGREPGKISKDTKAKIINIARATLFDQHFVFDGENTAWSIREICPPSVVRDAEITLPGARPKQVRLKIRCKGALSIGAFVQHLRTVGGPIPAERNDLRGVSNAINAVYRQGAAESTYCATASAFYKRSPEVLMQLQSTAGVLEAIRGTYQRLSLAFGLLSLNVDVTCAAFYVPDKSMVDVAAAFAQIRAGPDLQRAPPGSFDRLKGMFFRVRHLPDDSRAGSLKLRVNNISPQDATNTTFDITDPITNVTTQTSVAAYFANKYGIHLRLPGLPLLVTKKGSFPMEVCWTAPGERFKDVLQGAQTSDFIKFATSPAFVRRQQIESNVRHLAWHQQPVPWAMGLAVENKMLEMPGRILRAPVPAYKNGTAEGASSGKWNLRGKVLMQPKLFNSWAVLYFPGRQRKDDRTLQLFCKELLKSLETLGLRVPQGPPSFLMANPNGDIRDALVTLIEKTNNHFKCQKPDLIVVLAHQDMHSGIYKTVTQHCEVEFGVACQYLLVEKCTDQKGQLQYLANVGLKINAKLGGCSAIVDDPFFKRPFMMLGADCTHPRPAELRRDAPPPSVAALVGSYDRYGSQYTSIAVAQDPKLELIKDLGAMANELVQRFQHQNKRTPESVIYWRDSVGESQIPAFLSQEVETVKSVVKQHNPSCKLTVVNCIKRHHTRLFPRGKERSDKLGNVLPCTVVENDSLGKDIFVVTQAALQGTCRPTRYQVLLDEHDLSADEFQRLVVGGCFNYNRATRSVSLHSAVYYADQVAERAKNHLRTENGGMAHRDTHNDLAFTMWWQ